MKKEQEFIKKFQSDMNWGISKDSFQESRTDLLNNYMLLTTEVSEIAEEFRAMFNQTFKTSDVMGDQEAFEEAKLVYKENIGKEIIDCMAYLMKFANYFEIDVESTFLS
ncbi:MazG-like family protein [Bacillus suaedaesalsae]|uniref:MazG-like family protein n=1 Tax=Bacillus suaedaesalsae TaxID=2810349 RepID=UPI001EF4DA62|nr:MazG-like family protein [Bacillus suaedaesalsae]